MASSLLIDLSFFILVTVVVLKDPLPFHSSLLKYPTVSQSANYANLSVGDSIFEHSLAWLPPYQLVSCSGPAKTKQPHFQPSNSSFLVCLLSLRSKQSRGSLDLTASLATARAYCFVAFDHRCNQLANIKPANQLYVASASRSPSCPSSPTSTT